MAYFMLEMWGRLGLPVESKSLRTAYPLHQNRDLRGQSDSRFTKKEFSDLADRAWLPLPFNGATLV